MSGAHILVVDDNPTNLKLVSATLRYAGMRVSAAPDAETARQLLQQGDFDLVLTDLQLPGMDGLEFTRLLKADPALRRIPIIAVTASAMKQDEEAALSAGCTGFIPKPINTRTLPKQIADTLAASKHCTT